MKLNIAYFYKDQLNLYGDNGNIEILVSRCLHRNIDAAVSVIGIDTKLTSKDMKKFNFVFMGGGPDSGQKDMYTDLLNSKGDYLREYIENGGTGLFICGSYQLLGHYYQAADGSKLDGLGIFDMYTQHFGNDKPRCIGNVVCDLDKSVLYDPVFKNVNNIGSTLVGFENHGGRSYFNSEQTPLGTVVSGKGNNGEDSTEGIIYKNSFGTYLHGPVLSKNPHFADYLICKGLQIDSVSTLSTDDLIFSAHSAALDLV